MIKTRFSSRFVACQAIFAIFALVSFAPLFVPPLMAQNEGSRPIEESFYAAINNNDLAAVRSILEANPKSVNSPLRGGYTPLVCAIFSARLEVVQLLLEKGADPNQKLYGNTPLGHTLSGYADTWRGWMGWIPKVTHSSTASPTTVPRTMATAYGGCWKRGPIPTGATARARLPWNSLFLPETRMRWGVGG